MGMRSNLRRWLCALCLRAPSERSLKLSQEECAGAGGMNIRGKTHNQSINATAPESCTSMGRWQERLLPSSSLPGMGGMINHIILGTKMYYKENESYRCQVQPLQRNDVTLRHRKCMIQRKSLMVIIRLLCSGSEWHQSSSNKSKYCEAVFFKARNTERIQPKLKMPLG